MNISEYIINKQCWTIDKKRRYDRRPSTSYAVTRCKADGTKFESTPLVIG